MKLDKIVCPNMILYSVDNIEDVTESEYSLEIRKLEYRALINQLDDGTFECIVRDYEKLFVIKVYPQFIEKVYYDL